MATREEREEFQRDMSALTQQVAAVAALGQKLDALAVQQATLANQQAAVLATLSERCPFEAQQIHDLKDTVYGNGTPGLKVRMERNEAAVASLQEDRDKQSKVRLAVIGGAFGVAIAIVEWVPKLIAMAVGAKS